MKQNVILIFDVGKTNKKYYLFDESFHELESAHIQFNEKQDDDFFACDDLEAITKWVLNKYQEIKNNDTYHLKYINFSTYGATLVHLDETGKPCTHLYNYLKPFSKEVKELFIKLHGDIDVWSMQTSSPYLGMLNAGLQLFWLKHTKPQQFKQIHTTIFLPQYLSYLFTGNLVTEFTSLGCHSGMWNFNKNDYHKWMYDEGFIKLLPSITSSYHTSTISNSNIKVGVGIHDSSAALIPYIKQCDEPFILLSTGTWSICLNPFNNTPLTLDELKQDCLCFMQPNGQQVKASRFFLGGFFSKCVKQLNKHFNKDEKYHQAVLFNEQTYQSTQRIQSSIFFEQDVYENKYLIKNFTSTELLWFKSYEEAYHQLISELIKIQTSKIYLAKGSSPIQKIYIDGGFVKNDVFTSFLQHTLPDFYFISSESPLGSSLGAAIAVTEKNFDFASTNNN